MILTNDFEPLATWTPSASRIVVGVDSEGVWFLGPGCRKVGDIGQALRMTPAAAEVLASKHGGQVKSL